MKKVFNFEGTTYVLLFDSISINKGADIDYQSHNNSFSNFKQYQAIFNLVDFQLYHDSKLIIDSKYININKINFNLGKTICELIGKEIYHTEQELQLFKEECNNYLNNLTYKMPTELLIAHNYINDKCHFNYQDYDYMNIKKYEKIQIAIDILHERISKDMEK